MIILRHPRFFRYSNFLIILQPMAALHFAAYSRENLEIVKHILDMLDYPKQNVNWQAKDGTTPLHMAALRGNYTIVKLLLDHYGADANIKDVTGRKPSHMTKGLYSREHFDCTQALEVKQQDLLCTLSL